MISPSPSHLDDGIFLEKLILIDDKDGNTVPFKMNYVQEFVNQRLTNRTIIIKPRQVGVTTFFLAKMFKQVVTKHNQNVALITHNDALTARMLRRVKTMYDRMPLPANLKPSRANSSIHEQYFDTLNSTIYIGTAGAKVAGRGETVHFFLGSEVAHWNEVTEDPSKILTSFQDAVPLNGQIVLESTPNGEGSDKDPNLFYDIIQDVQKGDSVYNLIPLYWWWDIGYRIPKNSLLALPDDRGDIRLTDEEIALIKKVGIWDDTEVYERIRWRRRKIKEQKAMFWQEYLEDLATCFYSVKEPFYNWEVLEQLTHRCFPAPHRFHQAEVWFEPAQADENPSYLISVDPGQGKQTESVAKVWRLDLNNYQKIQQVANLSGLYDPTTFAPMVKQLGEYYYWAKIASESNGHGMAFCTEIKDYPNLYYRTDQISGVQSKHIGWMSTGAAKLGSNGTKIYAMIELERLLPIIETYDIKLVGQLRQVKQVGNGGIIFSGSDDHHDSAMIMAATRGVSSGRPSIEFIGSSGWSKW